MTPRQHGCGFGVEVLRRRVRVAQGQEPADLLLAGGRVVNVFTGRIERADVVVADGWIAGVGEFDWEARERIELNGRLVIPGLIDSHMHLESTLLAPAELAKLIVPRGTTATISDSHEVGNVLGIPGIEALIAASTRLPFDLFFTASSCVPCTAWEHAGAKLGPAEVRDLLARPRVLGLAEVMDTPAVLSGGEEVLSKVQAALEAGRVVDGHAPGMVGRDLMAYASVGVRSDHESGTPEEAREKARWGMLVQVREGTIARNLDALLPLLATWELSDRWTLVTDDIFPDELRRDGHLDGLLRRVVAGGVPPALAVRQASYVPARHYGLHDRGAVAPGYRADLAVVEDERSFKVSQVYKDGGLVAREGRVVGEWPHASLPEGNSVHLGAVTAQAFRLPLERDTALAIRVVPGQLVSVAERVSVARAGGEWMFDPERDVALVASLERHRATGGVGVGLASGFGFHRHGALGSSVAHDSHNLIVVGTNAEDMLACVRELERLGGGFVAATGGEVRSRLPLPFAGLLSRESAEVVCRQLREVRATAAELGCDRLPCPFGALSFLALPVIPALRITDQGLWDVVGQRFVRP